MFKIWKSKLWLQDSIPNIRGRVQGQHFQAEKRSKMKYLLREVIHKDGLNLLMMTTRPFWPQRHVQI